VTRATATKPEARSIRAARGRGRVTSPYFGTAFVVFALWTILVVAWPAARLEILAPRARPAMEMLGLVALALTCGLAYLRYTLHPSGAMLLMVLAFVVLTAEQLAFGVVTGPQAYGTSPQLSLYLWSVGRIVAALLLLLAVTGASRVPARGHPPRRLAIAGAAVLVALAMIDAPLWAFRSSLPMLSTASIAALAHGRLGPLTPVDYAVGIAGTALFVTVAVLLARPRGRQAIPLPWLGPTLVLAAFAHLDYMLQPAVFETRVSSGDIARVLFYLALLAGLLWDVYQVHRSERQRTADLAAAYEAERLRVEELEQLERAKADLFSMLTHELSHPVSAIRGFALTLAVRWNELDEETKVEMVQRLDRESLRLRDLAEGAVTATMMAGPDFPLVIRDERVVDLVRDAAEAVPGMADRLKVELDESAEDVAVAADRTRILQVLRNLVSNALKYSEPGSRITLSVTAEERGTVRFCVQNRGPGVDPRSMSSLFQRFSRVRPAGMEHVPGSGLGLYIARRIVEDHGGRIWAESEPGRDARFFFVLPAVAATHGSVAPTLEGVAG
jgi:signal transduction histidine kinase